MVLQARASAKETSALLLIGRGGDTLLDLLHYVQWLGNDFLNFGVCGFRTGIFNVADVCIACDVVIVILEVLWLQS